MSGYDPSRYVSFEELPALGPGERHAWDVFGRDDELGCLNFITAEAVCGAARLVEKGIVINLDLPLDQPQPQFWAPGRATPARHEKVGRQSRDDYLDGFYLQGSTQWDGLRHYRYREFGYFGAREDAALDAGALGIDRFAEHGIVTRGVMLDVEGYLRQKGESLDYESRYPIDGALLQATADATGVQMEPGDVLLIYTGWLEWYLDLPMARREELATAFASDRSNMALPGLDPSQATMAWLWNNKVAAVAADNPTLETLPYIPEEGWGHRRMLPLLGLPIGELWKLSELMVTCRDLNRYAFMLTSSPLNVPGGVGSPANAYAVL